MTALLLGDDDTIVAVATASGRGAVALVRLSGARAISIARALGAFGGTSGGDVLARRAQLITVRDPVSGDTIDQALVTAFVAPQSYTGEDVVELATHSRVRTWWNWPRTAVSCHHSASWPRVWRPVRVSRIRGNSHGAPC
jgi:tRNA U34 5-carboxymethylaminomethyl modifying GTPase MnmE/TrmE